MFRYFRWLEIPLRSKIVDTLLANQAFLLPENVVAHVVRLVENDSLNGVAISIGIVDGKIVTQDVEIPATSFEDFI